MKSRASGSLTTIRTLFFDPSGVEETTRRFLDSRMLIWLCGISFVLSGLAGIVHSVVLGWEIIGTTAVGSPGGERLYKALMVLGGLYALLICAGFLGLHLLLAKRRRWTKRLSAAGTLLVVISVVAL